MMPIERMRPEDFDAVFRLLSQSFPAGERRDAAGQRALLADSAYHIDILRAPSGGVQALMASWDFGGFVFFEHFAVDPACRSGGIGGNRPGFTAVFLGIPVGSCSKGHNDQLPPIFLSMR